MNKYSLEWPIIFARMNSPSLNSEKSRYVASLDAATGWLLRSVRNAPGGSCAYSIPLIGWSRPYPETTGYVIPTLLNAANLRENQALAEAAVELGQWLLDIQHEEGFWFAGLHPPKGTGQASIFNTAQILEGLVALYRTDAQDRWLQAASRGARWLALGVDSNGQWAKGHYRNDYQPAYYSRVAWPMLEVSQDTDDLEINNAATRVLECVIEKRQDNGSFKDWGFNPGQPAYTHTIAYTLRGLLESGRILDRNDIVDSTYPALELLRRQSELANGRLAGRFDLQWKSDTSSICVTGCAQIAICFLICFEATADLRWLNAAAKLTDFVCTTQSSLPYSVIKGAVPGSKPIWGPYMSGRYPNWATKFHADALIELIGWIDRQRVVECVSS
jgi:hypothetical protein